MNDPCCWLCRTPSGVCATAHTCDHHVTTQATEAASHRLTYPDPTGNTAARRADKDLAQRRRKGG